MSEAKFTPGLWEVTENLGGYEHSKGDYHFAIMVDDGERKLYLALTIGDIPGLAEQEEANAHLIAAAPEMYEALKAVYAGTMNGDGRGRITLNISLDALRLMENALTRACPPAPVSAE